MEFVFNPKPNTFSIAGLLYYLKSTYFLSSSKGEEISPTLLSKPSLRVSPPHTTLRTYSLLKMVLQRLPYS